MGKGTRPAVIVSMVSRKLIRGDARQRHLQQVRVRTNAAREAARKPSNSHVHEMKNSASNRSMRVVHRLRELFIEKGSDILVPDLVVFRE